MKNHFAGLDIDFIGFFTSILCGIHCMLATLVVTFSALGGIYSLESHFVEEAVLAISAIMAIFSLIPSYFRHHKKITPIISATIGFTLIVLAHLPSTELLELLLLPLGGCFIACGHWLNRNLLKNQ